MNYDQLCPGCFERETPEPTCPACGFNAAAPSGFALALPLKSILQGRYLVGRPLGQGGFGITYLGFDTVLHVKVAIKEFLPTGMISREEDRATVTPLSTQMAGEFSTNREKFLSEARLLAQLADAPSIVKVQNFFMENNTAYFTMEYVAGTSLKDRVAAAGGRLSWQETAHVLVPIAEALRQVHAHGILHRDISPDNISVTPQGQSKLLDFGAARFAAGGERSLSVILKHGFAPEEQYRTRGNQGPWTDLYALAATFYYCLTGSRPPDALDRLHTDSLLPPSALGVGIPGPAEAALVRALAVRSEARFASMEEFVAAMGGAVPVAAPRPVGPTQAVQPVGAAATQVPPPSGQPSLFARIGESKPALIALIVGGVAIVAALVVAIAVSGGGKDKGSSGGGGGSVVGAETSIATSTGDPWTESPTSEDPTAPTDEPTPSDEPTASEEPTPTEEPTSSEGDRFNSTILPVSFAPAAGWDVRESEGVIVATTANEKSRLVILRDPTTNLESITQSSEDYLGGVVEGLGADSYDLIAEDSLEDLSEYFWYQYSLVLTSGEDMTPTQIYLTSDGGSGVYQIFAMEDLESASSDLFDIYAMIASFTWAD